MPKESYFHLARWKFETRVSIQKELAKNNNSELTQFKIIVIKVMVAYV